MIIMKKMDEKLLIFDFDGTIADTKSLYYRAISEELRKYGFSADKVDKAIDLGMSLRKTLKNMGFGFVYSYFVKRGIMKKMRKYILEVRKCKDVDSIKKLKERKIVVTNSLKEFAVPVLKHLNLDKEFSEIYGADDFTDKAEFISEYFKENKINKNNCYYIGDRMADVRLARKVGCISVIISGKCAWDSRKEILKENPDFLLDDINEISEII